jgi:hypothetical protein
VFDTFGLDLGQERGINNALLDRFLACMKPASITLRRPCAGVFLCKFPNFEYRSSQVQHVILQANA